MYYQSIQAEFHTSSAAGFFVTVGKHLNIIGHYEAKINDLSRRDDLLRLNIR